MLRPAQPFLHMVGLQVYYFIVNSLSLFALFILEILLLYLLIYFDSCHKAISGGECRKRIHNQPYYWGE